jgi:hypothetical protein
MRARLGRQAASLQEESFGNSMVSLTALLIARSSKSIGVAQARGEKGYAGSLVRAAVALDRHRAHAMDSACA